jgi:hypothetical protein
VPTINLAADELAAVTAAIRRVIEDDRFPHAPRLDPLRGAGEARRGDKKSSPNELGSFPAAPPAKADKGARSAKRTA